MTDKLMPTLIEPRTGNGTDPEVPDIAAAFSDGGLVQVQEVQFSPIGPILPLRAPLPTSAALDVLMDVPLRVSVELGRARLPVKAVLALRPGSMVELDRMSGEPADVLVNDRLVARGEVVVVEDRFGVRITEIVPAARRKSAE